MDGVIIVIDAGATREPAFVHVLTEMERTDAHILGIVLNRFNNRSGSSYYYYERYYSDDDKLPGVKDSKSLKASVAPKINHAD
jgi:Mrp family chromosome partitioning ATPase